MVLLSITHNLRPKDEAELDVCEACKSSPHDGVSWWRVFGSSQVASEPCELGEIKGECAVGWHRPRSIGYQLVQQIEFRRGQCHLRGGFRHGTIDHRHPEDSPTEDAEDRDQVDDSLSRSQPDLFGLEA